MGQKNGVGDFHHQGVTDQLRRSARARKGSTRSQSLVAVEVALRESAFLVKIRAKLSEHGVRGGFAHLVSHHHRAIAVHGCGDVSARGVVVEVFDIHGKFLRIGPEGIASSATAALTRTQKLPQPHDFAQGTGGRPRRVNLTWAAYFEPTGRRP